MKLNDAALSFPVMRYELDVEHSSLRQPVVMEWLVLELVGIEEGRAGFSEDFDAGNWTGGVTLGDVLQDVFCIKDVDALVAPVVGDLARRGLISLPSFSAAEYLHELPLHAVSLTDAGREFRSRGSLPGNAVKDVVVLYYDGIHSVLDLRRPRGLEDEPSGLDIGQNLTGGDVFPAGKVRDFLETKRGDASLPWLSAEERIRDVSERSSSIAWQTLERSIAIEKDEAGRYFFAVDDEDEAVAGIVLENSRKQLETYGVWRRGADTAKGLPDARRVAYGPDMQLSWIDWPYNLGRRIPETLNLGKIAVIDADYADALKSDAGKLGWLQAVLVSSSDEGKAESENGVFWAHASEPLLPEGVICSGLGGSIGMANFELSAGQISARLPLVYSTGGSLDVEGIVCKYAHEHLWDDAPPLALLQAAGEKGLLEELIGRRLDGVSYADAVERVGTLGGALLSGEDGEGEQLLLSSLLASLPVARSYQQVSGLWEGLLEAGWDITCVEDSERTRLYGDNAVIGLLSLFSTQDLEEALGVDTSIEQGFLFLRQASDGIAEILPEVNLDGPLSEEDARRICSENRDKLGNVYSCVRAWNAAWSRLCKTVADFAGLAGRIDTLRTTTQSMGSLGIGLEPFYSAEMQEFDVVFIVDTCSLMNAPQILDAFEDGHALLVVSQVSLSELDGLKTARDEEKARAARAAIKALKSHEDERWLYLRDTSYPELLPDGIDPKRPDNKILSVAMHYIVKVPTLITDDRNFSLIARANGIASMSSEEFIKAQH